MSTFSLKPNHLIRPVISRFPLSFGLPASAAWSVLHWLRSKKNGLFLLGVLVIVLANAPLLGTGKKVNWDAFDEMWQYFRWIGSALREGYFPDFFPNILSGYPIGANIQAGVYNIFYLAVAFCFPDSVLSINLIYILTQIAIFCLVFMIGRTYALDQLSSLYFGLALVASGFVIGHAEHFSYLATAVGLLACFLSIRLALTNQNKPAFLLAVIGIYHALTAGYPTNIIFGAQCLLLYWLYLFVTEKSARRSLSLIPCAMLLGTLLSLPTLWHFLHQLQQSTRGEGLDIETALFGSLPSYGLLSFIFPLWKMKFSEPSMERFHLIFVSFPLTLTALWVATISRNDRKRIYTWLALALLFTILALGRNAPIPIRTWLAENFFIYRAGRFPSGEHRGMALFLLALVSAFGLQWLQQRLSRNNKNILIIIIVLDFFLVMYGLHYMRFSSVPKNYRGTVPRFQTAFNSNDQALLDAPRNCTPDGPIVNWETIIAQQRDLAPTKFYWNGYANLRDKTYELDRDRVAEIICGPSRLWLYETESPYPYKYDLITYTPSYIKFIIRSGNPGIKSKLIWADYNDGFWALKVNGRATTFEVVPAKLRGFYGMPGDVVEMVYEGPLSRLWRK